MSVRNLVLAQMSIAASAAADGSGPFKLAFTTGGATEPDLGADTAFDSTSGVLGGSAAANASALAASLNAAKRVHGGEPVVAFAHGDALYILFAAVSADPTTLVGPHLLNSYGSKAGTLVPKDGTVTVAAVYMPAVVTSADVAALIAKGVAAGVAIAS